MRKAQITVAILALLILGGFTWLATYSGITTSKLEHKTVKLQSAESKLKDINLQVEQLKTQSQKDKEKQAEQQKLLEQKEAEKQELQKQVQAKADAKAKLELAAANLRNTVSGRATASAAPAITGNKHTWLAASGIPQSDWGYVDMIVSRESGWNPCAYNPGKSDCNANPTSACGLAQSLPCGKQSKYGHWTDPVANLKWQYEYVKGRYGGYAGASAFWSQNHWY